MITFIFSQQPEQNPSPSKLILLQIGHRFGKRRFNIDLYTKLHKYPHMLYYLKKKYVLFIDESGKSKLGDTGDKFLLSSVIIEKSLHEALSSFMISLKRKNNISTLKKIL